MDSKLCEFKASPSCQSVLGFMLAVEVLRCESSASCSSPHSCHWLLCLPSGMNSNLLELYAQINSSRSCFRSGHFIIATEKPPICRDKRPQPKQARGGRADLGSRFQCLVYGEDVKAAGV